MGEDLLIGVPSPPFSPFSIGASPAARPARTPPTIAGSAFGGNVNFEQKHTRMTHDCSHHPRALPLRYAQVVIRGHARVQRATLEDQRDVTIVPASIRVVVLLPHSDGPTSTTSSLSSVRDRRRKGDDAHTPSTVRAPPRS